MDVEECHWGAQRDTMGWSSIGMCHTARAREKWAHGQRDGLVWGLPASGKLTGHSRKRHSDPP